jgi:hypothetical protein
MLKFNFQLKINDLNQTKKCKVLFTDKMNTQSKSSVKYSALFMHFVCILYILYTYAISAYHHYRFEVESHSGEVYSIQHFVIKFVSEL